MGPMGSGKSALLEAFSIFQCILSGKKIFKKEMKGYDLEEVSALKHFTKLKLKDLVNGDHLTLTMKNRGVTISILLTLSTEGLITKFTFSLLPLHDKLELRSDEHLSKLIEVLNYACKENVESANSIIKEIEDEDFAKTLRKLVEELAKRPDLRHDLSEILDLSSFIYLSSHRPSPSELRERAKVEDLEFEERVLDSEGFGVVQELSRLVKHRVSEKDKLERLEDLLCELGICSSKPSIEVYRNRELEIVKVEERSFEALSSGERNLITILLAILKLKKGVLIIEEPEIGIHIDSLLKLLEAIYAEIIRAEKDGRDLRLVLSTHSVIPLNAIRRSIRENKLHHEDITLHFVYRKAGKTNPIIWKVCFNEYGFPIQIPDALQVIEEDQLRYIEALLK